LKVLIRLEDLMWENRVKSINKLSEQTGISRPSLTRMKNNESRGVNFETVETLCQFFDCDINDFLYIEKERAKS